MPLGDWSHPAPVLFDVETRSAADLREVGGRLYCEDPSTRMLCAVFLVDGVYHVWFPYWLEDVATRIHPDQIQPDARRPVDLRVYVGGVPPAVSQAARAGRPFVAHNCFGFDRWAWRSVMMREMPGLPEPTWLDTLPLVRASGLPGRLDKLGKLLAGRGKDGGSRVLKKIMREDGKAVLPGDLGVVARYNVVDVQLLERVWREVEDTPVEADVIAVHDAVNCRGIGLDEGLAGKLVSVSGESVARAADRIAELTGGVLGSHNLRSVPQVRAWLASHGLVIRDGFGKETLRKDAVQRAIDNPHEMLSPDSPVEAVDDIDPAVFEVLRLRLAALRITGAKGDRAVARTSPDGRARDLFTYHQAHTGRWSSAGIQVHNLPRPKPGVPVGRLLELHESGEWSAADPAGAYQTIASMLPAGLTVDDAISALLRPLFVPRPGHDFAVCDFAAIECRGVAWMAGETGLIEALTTGQDVYKIMAGTIFGCDPAAVTDSQRHVGKTVVLGCSYGMGADKFRIYCSMQGINLARAGATAETCVNAFRGLYQRIAGSTGYISQRTGRPVRKGGLWRECEDAAMSAVRGRPAEAGKCYWSHRRGHLYCQLPSGRSLVYRNCRIEERVPFYARDNAEAMTKPTLVYDGAYGEMTTYSGKLTENIVQACCRDLLAAAMVEAERRGLNPCGHVHDELVCEAPREKRAEVLQQLAECMTTVPTWAAGLPVAVSGHTCPRYLKKAPKGYEEVEMRSST